MKAVKKSKRRLSFESLEARTMLAGNVTAALDGIGNLSLKGDSKNNVVTVAQASNGRWVVRGLLGTTINGKSVQTYGINGGIKANLGNGNDAIAVLRGEIFGELSIATGNGNDAVAVVKVDVGTLRVNTGAGNDVTFVNSVVAGFALPTALSSTTSGFGNAYISTGAGMDMTLISNLEANSTCVNTGAGTDFTGLINVQSTRLLSVKTGTEFDALGVVRSSAGSAKFDGGDRAANLFAGSKNLFGSESNNFSAKLKLDAIAAQVERLLSTAKTYLKSIPGIGSLPILR